MFVKILVYFGLTMLSLFVIDVCVCQPDYQHEDNVVGWTKLHRTPTTFKEAYMMCYYEGAVLGSPINEALADVMEVKRNMTNGVMWIGTHSLFSEDDFISAEEYQYEPRTGSCYKLHEERQEWTRAQLICTAEGGYLAVVNDEEEAMILKNMSSKRALKVSKYNDWEPMFIGIRDWDKKGIWSTVQGDSIENVYNVWGWGQPDNLGQNQYCGSLLKNGQLDDTWCHAKALFMCERDPNKTRFTDPSTKAPTEPDLKSLVGAA
ncbi:hypothetical protein PYW07_017435 [Mythimna separata]|uniref:C-type lectin domain-containing protein n=1 Tax=Mythimna separata TaxID=271217 RepID=A0AAD8DXE9_MYTSE|nr:hypothetical protein PYW07_017435 [Mythimna separata]